MAAPCIYCGDAPKDLPLHRCVECQETNLPMDVQIQRAYLRRGVAEAAGMDRPKVPREEWPEGRRWCAGCYSFRRFDKKGRKLDVCPGHTQCRPCEVSSRRARNFGVSREEDVKMGVSCQICGRAQKFQALAMDHDHATGRVRGKLCFWCNHFILGPAEIAHQPLEYFKKVVKYLEGA